MHGFAFLQQDLDQAASSSKRNNLTFLSRFSSKSSSPKSAGSCPGSPLVRPSARTAPESPGLENAATVYSHRHVDPTSPPPPPSTSNVKPGGLSGSTLVSSLSRSSSFELMHSSSEYASSPASPARAPSMVVESSTIHCKVTCATALLMQPPAEMGLSFAKFRLGDKKPVSITKAMLELQLLDQKLRSEGRVEDHLLKSGKGARKRDILKIKSLEIRSRRKQGVEVESPYQGKKTKTHRTRFALFHELNLAIRDRDVRKARGLVELLQGSALRKKSGTKAHREANKCFLAALAARMEGVVLLMMYKGFPSDFNVPVYSPGKRMGETFNDFSFPNYFLLAVSFGLVNVVRCMIKHAHVNQSWFGLTPLMVALAHIPPNGDLEIVHILMEAGADPNQGILLSQLRALHRLQPRKVLQSLSTAAPESGYIRILPLDLACAVGNKSAVLLLLQSMDSSSVFQSRFCLLAQQHDTVIIGMLIVAGADLHQKDCRGNTALHLASKAGRILVASMLIHAGLDVNEPGEGGITPLELSKQNGHLALQEYLTHLCQTSASFPFNEARIKATDEAQDLHNRVFESIQEAVHLLCPTSQNSSSSSSVREFKSRSVTPDPFAIKIRSKSACREPDKKPRVSPSPSIMSLTTSTSSMHSVTESLLKSPPSSANGVSMSGVLVGGGKKKSGKNNRWSLPSFLTSVGGK